MVNNPSPAQRTAIGTKRPPLPRSVLTARERLNQKQTQGFKQTQTGIPSATPPKQLTDNEAARQYFIKTYGKDQGELLSNIYESEQRLKTSTDPQEQSNLRYTIAQDRRSLYRFGKAADAKVEASTAGIERARSFTPQKITPVNIPAGVSTPAQVITNFQQQKAFQAVAKPQQTPRVIYSTIKGPPERQAVQQNDILAGPKEFVSQGKKASEILSRTNLPAGFVGSSAAGVVGSAVGLAEMGLKPKRTLTGVFGLQKEFVEDIKQSVILRKGPPTRTLRKLAEEQKESFLENPAYYAGSFAFQTAVFSGGAKVFSKINAPKNPISIVGKTVERQTKGIAGSGKGVLSREFSGVITQTKGGRIGETILGTKRNLQSILSEMGESTIIRNKGISSSFKRGKVGEVILEAQKTPGKTIEAIFEKKTPIQISERTTLGTLRAGRPSTPEPFETLAGKQTTKNAYLIETRGIGRKAEAGVKPQAEILQRQLETGLVSRTIGQAKVGSKKVNFGTTAYQKTGDIAVSIRKGESYFPKGVAERQYIPYRTGEIGIISKSGKPEAPTVKLITSERTSAAIPNPYAGITKGIGTFKQTARSVLVEEGFYQGFEKAITRTKARFTQKGKPDILLDETTTTIGRKGTKGQIFSEKKGISTQKQIQLLLEQADRYAKLRPMKTFTAPQTKVGRASLVGLQLMKTKTTTSGRPTFRTPTTSVFAEELVDVVYQPNTSTFAQPGISLAAPKTVFEQSLVQRENPISIQRPSLSPRTSPRSTPIQNPIQQPSQRPIQTPFTRPITRPVIIPTLTPVLTPTTTPTTVPTTIPTTIPTTVPITTPTTIPITTPTTIPITTPIGFPFTRPRTPIRTPSRGLFPTRKSVQYEQGYSILSRKGGKLFKFEGIFGKSEAFARGSRLIDTSLRASFKVVAEPGALVQKKPGTTPSPLKFELGKGGFFIEPRSRRLSTIGEIVEIRTARKNSGLKEYIKAGRRAHGDALEGLLRMR